MALAVTSDGSQLIVAGSSEGTTLTSDFQTIAYNATTGAYRWSAAYNGPRNGNETATALAVSPDGTKAFVTGPSETSNLNSFTDYATVAYSTT